MKILFIATLMIPILWTTKTNTFSQDFMKDDDQQFSNRQLMEKYLFEAKKLQEEFCPIFERLLEEGWIENEREKVQDCKKWIDEYDLPLLEKSRQAMQNVTGTDDYLSLWERNFPHDILASLSPEESKSTTVSTWNFITETIHRNSGKSAASSPVQYTDHGISLFNVYMLSVIAERRDAICHGTRYSSTSIKAEYEKKKQDILERQKRGDAEFHDNLLLKRIDYLLTFDRPSIAYPSASPAIGYDVSWDIMAIYSFKNDRARDILFEMVVNSQDDQPLFQADWAAYYLSLFPSSSELLPRLETYLKKEIAREKRDNPNRMKYFLDDHDELINPFRRPDTLREKINGIPYHEWKTLSDSISSLFRLATLVHSLKFNEQIPPEELERFNIARRELAIAWSLKDKVMPIGGINILITLQKGDEHFQIYMTEYPFPGAAKYEFRWEEDGKSYPNTLENPFWQNRKEFYERELANPRPIYTENQMEYIREQIKSINHRFK